MIDDLTPRDVLAIEAALSVASDDETEPFPGIRDALAKVTPVADRVRASGYVAHPETSVQSQMMIDGAAPWPK